MSSKKNRKTLNIFLSACMLLGIGVIPSYASTADPYGKNGVSYVLLDNEFGGKQGIYRFNDYDGEIRQFYKTKNFSSKYPVFKTSDIRGGTVEGLAADQINNVFCLAANNSSDEDYSPAQVGWLPEGINFPDDSPIYIDAMLPSEGNVSGKPYIRSGCPHSPYDYSFPANNVYQYNFWYRNVPLNGKTYSIVCRFNGPTGVRYLDGDGNTITCSTKDDAGLYGIRGTPIWDGTYKPGSSSNAAALRHPTDTRKIIPPSHIGVVGYFLYGNTRGRADWEGLPMNGAGGRPRLIYSDSAGSGYYSGSPYSGQMFNCIVKRIYDVKENSLDLYKGHDGSTPTNIPTYQALGIDPAGGRDVLKTVDVKVRETYGKICGDDCITGGPLQDKEVASALSTVTVVTSTTGARYGYNPLGKKRATDCSRPSDAALRKVKDGTESIIDISWDKNGTSFRNITNTAYLTSEGVTPASIKTFGVSSNFAPGADDYLYASKADHFAVQDSWWGLGGVAYEYYKGSGGSAGTVRKIDYMNNPAQTTYATLGPLPGQVDGIAVDGDGYLYSLVTEVSPADTDMNTMPSINPNLVTQTCSFGGKSLTVTLSPNWLRDVSYIDPASGETRWRTETVTGSLQPYDYKEAKAKQNVFKAVKRYPQTTGNHLGTEEERGYLFAGTDSWINRYEVKPGGSKGWSGAVFTRKLDECVSIRPAELAVVNVADSPITASGTTTHYAIIPGNPGVSFAEHSELTFKVEGYKPVVDGVQTSLKSVGNLATTPRLDNVRINATPGVDGRFAFDEDNDPDHHESGFPSTMFEANGKTTVVKWYIYQVENPSANDIDLNGMKILKTWEDAKLPNIPGDEFKQFKYKFLQPGNYAVKAKVTYYYFDNYGTAARPNNLTFKTDTFETKPKFVKIYANDLNLNNSPSYITNVSMNFTPNHYGTSRDHDTATFNAIESEKTVDPNQKSKFGKLTIQFDAQFYWEENVDNSGNYVPHGGIGVWDYQYYNKLYNEAKSKIKGIKNPYNFSGGVYNRTSSSLTSANLNSIYSKTIYNPGKPKSPDTTYPKGTNVSGNPKSSDLSFIQYALYLRPITIAPSPSVDSLPLYERGDHEKYCIKSGKLDDTDASISMTPVTGFPRKYTFKIKDLEIETDKLATPIDPYYYTIDLEIIYPRVTWLRNDLSNDPTGSSRKYYFSSVVPAGTDPDTGLYVSPIHVISKIDTTSLGGLNGAVTQSYSDLPDGTPIFKNEPSFTLCIRDDFKSPNNKNVGSMTKLLGFKNDGAPRVDNTIGTYTTSTGEELPNNVTFMYRLTDNNPIMQILEGLTIPPGNTKVSETGRNNRKNLNVYLQEPNGSPLYGDSSSRKFKLAECSSRTWTPSASDEYPIIFDSLNSSTDPFFAKDTWRVNINYKDNVNLTTFLSSINAPSTLACKPITHDFNSLKSDMTGNLHNWTGTLNWTVAGGVYDGYGVDGLKRKHLLYASGINRSMFTSSPWNSSYPTSSDYNIKSVNEPYLSRLDNDPPSIKVELISQNDNRRFSYELIENNYDKPYHQVKNAADVSKLGPCRLIIKEYQISGTGSRTHVDNKAIPGCVHNSYSHRLIGNPLVRANYTARLKRGGRLLINVDTIDNCGYNKFKKVWFKITDSAGEVVNSGVEQAIGTDASHDLDGKIKPNYKNGPRGVFAIDLPMTVSAGQPQLTILVHSEDLAGNFRELRIPVEITDTALEAHVLETTEERQER